MPEQSVPVTPRVFTVEEGKAWADAEAAGIRRGWEKCEEVKDYMRHGAIGAHLFETWKAGCWMNHCLRELGADEKTVFSIGFCHGQRSAFAPVEVSWQWAVRYLNEYAASRTVRDQPGAELADRIIVQQMPGVFPPGKN